MLGLTRKTVHAIEAVVDIACRDADHPVQMIDLADRLGVPRRYLEPVLQKLVKATVLRGVRGPKGGYRLGRPRYEISVACILDALGPDDIVDQPSVLKSLAGEKGVMPVLQEVETQAYTQLRGITLDALCARVRQTLDRERAAGPSDFVI